MNIRGRETLKTYMLLRLQSQRINMICGKKKFRTLQNISLVIFQLLYPLLYKIAGMSSMGRMKEESYEIRGSHSGTCEDYCLLGYDAL
jgi:hypothetical protein